jgi:hypothetical protein
MILFEELFTLPLPFGGTEGGDSVIMKKGEKKPGKPMGR